VRPRGMSSLSRKFDLLQERAQRKAGHEAGMDLSSLKPGMELSSVKVGADLSSSKASIDMSSVKGVGDSPTSKMDVPSLKEFYLQKLAKNENGSGAGRLVGGSAVIDAAQPQATGQQVARPTFAPNTNDIEDLEIMCNNCFNLIKSSEAAECSGDPGGCPLAQRSGGGSADRPSGAVGLLDLKLKRLRSALEARLQDASSKVNVMRHLTQLRYHIDTAIKWVPGCPEIGALSDHTVVQVKQLTATSRVLAPAVYIFSKRIENVVVQKERELRRAMVQQTTKATPDNAGSMSIVRDDACESVADVNSIVSEMDSDCGTQYAETLVTQQEGAGHDVGNVQDANDYLSLRNEDEQRRWFYSQCLTVKLACPDKNRAKKMLISDLYAKVKGEGVAIESWVPWIRNHLMPEGQAAAQQQDQASGSLGELEVTVPVPPHGNRGGTVTLPLREGQPQAPVREASSYIPPSRVPMSHPPSQPHSMLIRKP